MLIEIGHGVVLLLLAEVVVDIFVQFIKDFSEIFSFGELFEELQILYPFPEFSLPATVRDGSCFEAHFISKLLHVAEHLFVCVEFDAFDAFGLEHGEDESGEPGDGVGVGFGEEEPGSGWELVLVLLGEALEAGGNVK